MDDKKGKASVFLFCFLLFCACGGPPLSSDEQDQKMPTVGVVYPSKRTFSAEIVVSGTAMPNQQVTLYAMESGAVRQIGKDIGDQVQQGTVIAQLENPALHRAAQQQAALAQAKHAAYQRLSNIRQQTPALVPLQELEQARAEDLAAAAADTLAQDRLDFLEIKAPFAGVITQRFVDPGALVQSGLLTAQPQAIVELQDVNPIRLQLPLPAGDVAWVRQGTKVVVDFPVLPGEGFKGKVSRMAGALDPASKTMQVEVDIPNPSGRIKPGMYARTKLLVQRREEVLSLPQTALWTVQHRPHVLLVNAGGVVEKRPLEEGLNSKDFFEVRNPDITAATAVIVQGKGLVQPGQHVSAVPLQPTQP